MSVTSPPRAPRSNDPSTHDEFEALVDALIEEARQRQRRRRRKYAAVVAIIVVGGLAVSNIVGGAAPSQTASPAVAANTSVAVAPKQRIRIQATGPSGDSSGAGTFVFTALGSGPFKSDSGTESSTWTVQSVIRQGQDVKVVDWLNTLVGTRGTLVFHARLEHVSAGNGYEIATGTWKVVRGTGQYADLKGGGRVANVWRIDTAWTERREGFLVHVEPR